MIASVDGAPASVPCSALWAIAVGTSMPYGFEIPPVESESATMRAPSSESSRARFEPTLPKPWIATRASWSR